MHPRASRVGKVTWKLLVSLAGRAAQNITNGKVLLQFAASVQRTTEVRHEGLTESYFIGCKNRTLTVAAEILRDAASEEAVAAKTTVESQDNAEGSSL